MSMSSDSLSGLSKRMRLELNSLNIGLQQQNVDPSFICQLTLLVTQTLQATGRREFPSNFLATLELCFSKEMSEIPELLFSFPPVDGAKWKSIDFSPKKFYRHAAMIMSWSVIQRIPFLCTQLNQSLKNLQGRPKPLDLSNILAIQIQLEGFQPEYRVLNEALRGDPGPFEIISPNEISPMCTGVLCLIDQFQRRTTIGNQKDLKAGVCNLIHQLTLIQQCVHNVAYTLTGFDTDGIEERAEKIGEYVRALSPEDLKQLPPHCFSSYQRDAVMMIPVSNVIDHNPRFFQNGQNLDAIVNVLGNSRIPHTLDWTDLIRLLRFTDDGLILEGIPCCVNGCAATQLELQHFEVNIVLQEEILWHLQRLVNQSRGASPSKIKRLVRKHRPSLDLKI